MIAAYEPQRADRPDYLFFRRQTNQRTPLHFHACYEYLCCTQGMLRIQIDGKTYDLKAGEAAVIFPYQIHSVVTLGSSKNVVCVFSSSFIAGFFETHKHRVAHMPVFDFSKYAAAVNDCLEREGNRYRKKACFYWILSELADRTKFETRHADSRELLAKVLEYVNDNLAYDLSLKQIAAELHVSYNYLSSLFNRTFNMRFSAFLNELRISMAQRFMCNPSEDKNVSEIAAACGYASIRSFNRNFLAVAGQTPSAFRRQRQEEKH